MKQLTVKAVLVTALKESSQVLDPKYQIPVPSFTWSRHTMFAMVTKINTLAFSKNN